MSPAEREAQALLVLDSLHKHVALLDRDGVVVLVNRAWRTFGEASGLPPEQAASVGRNYLDLCRLAHGSAAADDARTARDGIAGVLDGSLPHFESEYPCHGAGGKRWFLMRVSPLPGAGCGAVVTYEDITERWQLQQQHTALIADLQEANRELVEFAYVVSHDLKAPLRGISSLASWLVSDFGDKLGPEGREHLVLIASRVKRLAGLIDAILAYSRAGRSVANRQPVALDALLRNAIELLAPPPRIRVDILRPLPELMVDAVKIQQVFQNLLSNAFDFMDKPQGVVRIDAVLQGTDWHFSVEDNGPGIEPRHFERIFHLFQTLATRDELERTGVGLALVKKIVETEGGRIWVESTVGAGSTFHFTLPAASPAA